MGRGINGAGLLGLMPSTALVVASDAPATIREAALEAKAHYGNLIQICDGTHDEVEEQAAIDLLHNTYNGGSVSHTSGHFSWQYDHPDAGGGDEVVHLYSNISFISTPDTTFTLTITQFPGVDQNLGMLGWNTASNIEIIGGIFDGQKATTPAHWLEYLIHGVVSTTTLRVSKVYLKNSTRFGQCVLGDHQFISEVITDSNSVGGIAIQDTSTDVNIDGHVSLSDGNALMVEGTVYRLNVTNFGWYNNTKGAYIDGALYRPKFSNGEIYDPVTNAFGGASTGPDVIEIENVSIEKNTHTNCSAFQSFPSTTKFLLTNCKINAYACFSGVSNVYLTNCVLYADYVFFGCKFVRMTGGSLDTSYRTLYSGCRDLTFHNVNIATWATDGTETLVKGFGNPGRIFPGEIQGWCLPLLQVAQNGALCIWQNPEAQGVLAKATVRVTTGAGAVADGQMGINATNLTVDSCEAAWTGASAHVTNTQNTTDFERGSASSQIAFIAGGANNDYSYDNIASKNLVAYTHLVFKIKPSASIAAADLAVRLYDAIGGEGGAGVLREQISLPTLVTGAWNLVCLTLATPAADGAIQSIELKYIANWKVNTILMDDVRVITIGSTVFDGLGGCDLATPAIYDSMNILDAGVGNGRPVYVEPKNTGVGDMLILKSATAASASIVGYCYIGGTGV